MAIMNLDAERVARAFRESQAFLDSFLLFQTMLAERWPLYVHYVDGRSVFTKRDEFFILPAKLGPTDCVWIVPGSV